MSLNRTLPALLLVSGLCALPAAACGRDPGDERLNRAEPPPAAAMLAPRQEGEDLDQQLARLRAELDAGMAGDPERLLQAEAITDGLMEARRPFDWLGTAYDLEARLRQLQAMADRVVAQLRRGATLDDVEEDVEAMRASADDLRTQMARAGGGPAPPPLDSLLAQDPLAGTRAGPRTPGGEAGATQGTPAGQAQTGQTPAAETPAQPAAAPPPRQGGPLGRPVNPDTSGVLR